MVRIRLIWVGKAPAPSIRDEIDKYRTRLRPYAEIELVRVKPTGTHGDAGALRARETDAVAGRLRQGSTHVVLDQRGEQFSSPELATWLKATIERCGNQIDFVIGGAYGLDIQRFSGSIKRISLSQLTFPHRIARLVLVEQIYRAFTILHGHGYHH